MFEIVIKERKIKETKRCSRQSLLGEPRERHSRTRQPHHRPPGPARRAVPHRGGPGPPGLPGELRRRALRPDGRGGPSVGVARIRGPQRRAAVRGSAGR